MPEIPTNKNIMNKRKYSFIEFCKLSINPRKMSHKIFIEDSFKVSARFTFIFHAYLLDGKY